MSRTVLLTEPRDFSSEALDILHPGCQQHRVSRRLPAGGRLVGHEAGEFPGPRPHEGPQGGRPQGPVRGGGPSSDEGQVHSGSDTVAKAEGWWGQRPLLGSVFRFATPC